MFTVPPGGDGVYYFSTYLLVEYSEYGYFDTRCNDHIICSVFLDHYNSGVGDYVQGSCSAVVDVVAGNGFEVYLKKSEINLDFIE